MTNVGFPSCLSVHVRREVTGPSSPDSLTRLVSGATPPAATRLLQAQAITGQQKSPGCSGTGSVNNGVKECGRRVFREEKHETPLPGEPKRLELRQVPPDGPAARALASEASPHRGDSVLYSKGASPVSKDAGATAHSAASLYYELPDVSPQVSHMHRFL